MSCYVLTLVMLTRLNTLRYKCVNKHWLPLEIFQRRESPNNKGDTQYILGSLSSKLLYKQDQKSSPMNMIKNIPGYQHKTFHMHQKDFKD